MRKLELYWPLKNPFISQAFGDCYPNVCDFYHSIGLKAHNGIDLSCPTGEPIYAPCEGTVTYAGMDGKEGYGVVIRTDEQYYDINIKPYYWKIILWHLLSNIVVKVGQKVKVGDIIGYGDTTGYATAPHLHFGIKPQLQGENEWSWWNVQQNNGYFGAVDPMPYMSNLTAYQARTALQNIAEQIKKISELLSNFLSGRKTI